MTDISAKLEIWSRKCYIIMWARPVQAACCLGELAMPAYAADTKLQGPTLLIRQHLPSGRLSDEVPACTGNAGHATSPSHIMHQLASAWLPDCRLTDVKREHRALAYRTRERKLLPEQRNPV